MPTIAIVDGVKIQFFFNDHPPRHFHIEYAGQRATVRLDDLQLLFGDFPASKLESVRSWARTHRTELELCWDLASKSENPGKVG